MSATDMREIEQVLARTVRELGEVQTNALRAKLPKPFQRPRAELEAALRALADRGEVFRHPAVKTKFLSYDARAAVRKHVVEVLGPKALTEVELKRQVAKKAAPLGLGRSLGPLAAEALRALVRGGQAFEHRAPPPPGESKRGAPKTLRYATVAQGTVELGPYLKKTVREMKALLKRLAPFGATAEGALLAFARELGVAGPPQLEAPRGVSPGVRAGEGVPRPNGEHGNGAHPGKHAGAGDPGVRAGAGDEKPRSVNGGNGSNGGNGGNGGNNGGPVHQKVPGGVSQGGGRDAPADPEGRLLWALDEVAAREPAGALLLVERVRARAGLDKVAFDRAALDLSRAERVVLHYHDYPASLSAAKLAEFVKDDAGTYYIGIARRRDEEA